MDEKQVSGGVGHTAGPWEKFPDDNGLFAICSGPDTVVCRGIWNEADADLIAAVPSDLLVALREADWAIAGLLKELRVDQSAWNNPLPDSTLFKVRAAIAKAVKS